MATIFKRNVDITAGTGDVNRFNSVFFDFMEDLIAQGYRVLGSGDGNTFENDDETAGATGTGTGGGYHLFTQALTIDTSSPWPAENWGNVNGFPNNLGASWIRFATPTGAVAKREFVFQIQWRSNPGTGYTVMIAMCKGTQKFNTGATAWQPPDVNTGAALVLAEVNPTYDPTFPLNVANALVPSAAGVCHWIIGDATKDFDFLFLSNRTNGTGFLFASFGLLRTVAPPGLLATPDPDPYVVVCTMESGGGNTSDDFAGSNSFLRPEDTGGNLDRYEDRTGGSSGTPGTLYATYGLDDSDAIAAGLDGTYSVACLRLSVQDSGGIQGVQTGFTSDPATQKSLVIPTVGIGRFGDAAAITHRFLKGYLKNDLLWFHTRGDTPPKVEAGPTPAEARLSWTNFSVLWGDPTVNIQVG
jgi:hypothetical protein